MTKSVHDERLLEGKENALEALSAFEIDNPQSQTILEQAKNILSDSTDEFRRAIRRADVTDEVRDILDEPRGKAGDALVRVYYTAMRRYAERRASGEAMTERDKQVEEFLKNFSPSEYVNTSFPGAIQSLEKAINFANDNLPDDVKNFAQNALDRAKEVRQNIEEAGENALENFSNLEEARETAKDQYLAARELTSAALRLAGRNDELNDLVPPVSDVMAP